MPTAPPPTEAEAKAAAERSEKLQKTYSIADTQLREAHKEEFEQLRVKAAADLGIEYVPRKTKAEKAREAIAAVLADNPGLDVSDLLAQTADSDTPTP